MSACEYLSTASTSTVFLHRPSSYHTRRPSSDRLARKLWPPSTGPSLVSQNCTIRHHSPLDGTVLLSRDSYRTRQPTSLDDSADMEHRPKQARVTLPPLSALTTSIDLERSRAQPSPHDRGHMRPSPVMAPRDAVLREARRSSSSLDSEDPRVQADLRWSKDPSFPREPCHSPSSSSSSFRPHSNLASADVSSSLVHNEPAFRSTSPRLATSSVRGIVESTRPRSFSSPHRDRIRSAPRRPSLADTSEVDRLLDSLLYVQDINRRLGLPTTRPASPSIFQHSNAAELLHHKLLDELDNMALFSQSRAESVATHIGLGNYLAPRRRSGTTEKPHETLLGRNSTLPAPAVSSGQAGPADWPQNDSPERSHSSIGRLTLEERQPRDLAHHHRAGAIDRDYREARLDPRARGRDGYAAQPIHVAAAPRPISRAISFEHPRALPQLHQHGSIYEHAPTDLPRFEAESRSAHAQPALHPNSNVAPPPPSSMPMYFADSRPQQQMDFLDRRRLAGKGMKRVRKRKNEHHQECLGCQAKETPEWRKGPMGPRTLCNACGLLYAKLTKRKQQEAEAAARASGKSAEEIVREREESPGAKQASLEALRAELNLANGMRNRPSSSSASIGGANSLHTPQSAAEYRPPCPLDAMHFDAAPDHQSWSTRHPEEYYPFAHHAPAHRIMAVSTDRSNSVGHIEDLKQLASHRREPGSGLSAGYSHPEPMRPYTGGENPASRPMPHQPGRQRSSTLQSSAAAPPRYMSSFRDGAVSPGSSASHTHVPFTAGVQRRPHPYM